MQHLLRINGCLTMATGGSSLLLASYVTGVIPFAIVMIVTGAIVVTSPPRARHVVSLYANACVLSYWLLLALLGVWEYAARSGISVPVPFWGMAGLAMLACAAWLVNIGCIVRLWREYPRAQTAPRI